MTFEELEDEIILKVDSGTASMDAAVPGMINEAVLFIANEPGIVLPSLKTVVSINTVEDQSYTSLTSGYDAKILYASFGDDKDKVEIYNTVEDLMNDYVDLDTEGNVEAVALEGNVLWYTKVPEDATAMVLLLYKNPTTLTLTTDIPTDIPVHLHRGLIVNKVAEWMFDLIEQSDDGNKANTMAAKYAYGESLQKLREYLGARRRGKSRSIWNY